MRKTGQIGIALKKEIMELLRAELEKEDEKTRGDVEDCLEHADWRCEDGNGNVAIMHRYVPWDWRTPPMEWLRYFFSLIADRDPKTGKKFLFLWIRDDGGDVDAWGLWDRNPFKLKLENRVTYSISHMG